jgi:hypothetical protein
LYPPLTEQQNSLNPEQQVDPHPQSPLPQVQICP